MPVREEKKQQTHQAFINAAFKICYEKGSFSYVSLRELSQVVDRVPTAFYRHFDDMQQLGLELVDRASNDVRNIMHHIGKMTLQQPPTTCQQRLHFFFESVISSAATWYFFISGRSNGPLELRRALQREYDFLLQDIISRLDHLPHFKHLQDANTIEIFAEFYLQFIMGCATDCLNIQVLYSAKLKLQKQQALEQSSLKKIQFLSESMGVKKPA